MEETLPHEADASNIDSTSTGKFMSCTETSLISPDRRQSHHDSGARFASRAACMESTLGFEDEVDGILLGAEKLPRVGMAGVLVLPQRPCILSQHDCPLLDSELDGWAPDCEWFDSAPSRLYDSAEGERCFAAYVHIEVFQGGSAPSIQQDLEHVRMIAGCIPQRQIPAHGPSLLQLAKDPSRREECPVCSLEWSQAFNSHGQADSAEEEPVRRRSSGRRGKAVHSLRCTWSWFQQSLCGVLCALRFDGHGSPLRAPLSASAVLPPPMADVWQYWRRKQTNKHD